MTGFICLPFRGSTIPAGCGTLTELSLDGGATGLTNIIVSDADGQEIDFGYYDDGGGLNVQLLSWSDIQISKTRHFSTKKNND